MSSRLPKIIWEPVENGAGIQRLFEHTRTLDFPLDFDDDRVNNSFRQQNETWNKGIDYILKTTQPVVLEPIKGMAILNGGSFVAATRIHNYFFPNPFTYLLYKCGLKPSKKLKEAIHFDGYVSDNYYHFYNEVLCPFWMLTEAGISMDKPLIVGETTYHTRHFQWLLRNNAWFASLPWVVMDGKTFIEVETLYKPISLIPPKVFWSKTKELFSPPLIAAPQRKVYLYRAPKFGRTVRNMEEVRPVLDKYGFECVDTGEMTIEQQMQLFAETRYLIAIHGAGITNIVFSNWEQLHMLEILPGTTQMNTHYYWMANMLGIHYDALVSGNMDAQKVFYLDPAQLEQSIIKILQTA